MVKMTLFKAYNDAKKKLKAAGIEAYGFEAREIMRHLTGYTNAQIINKYDEQLTPYLQTIYNSIMEKRLNHYPLQYILGCWSFYGYEFLVGEGVLIPRADTETLVDVALDYLKNKKEAKVLDLCSGSGCVAVAIEKNSDATVTAVEKFDTPFQYLERNIAHNKSNVTAVKEDVFSFSTDERYDLIVSNPPYISAEEMEIIDTETSFEPDTALYGGEDGLLFYRLITSRYKRFLKDGGMLALEVGFAQAEAVKTLMRDSGYTEIGTKEDINGIQRVVFGTVKKV